MNRQFYYFNIGRGGRYYNPNYHSFIREADINDITADLTFYERDSQGKFHYTYYDNSGDPIISKSDLDKGIKNGRVFLEFDTVYNTDIYTTVENMNKNEWYCLLRERNTDIIQSIIESKIKNIDWKRFNGDYKSLIELIAEENEIIIEEFYK